MGSRQRRSRCGGISLRQFLIPLHERDVSEVLYPKVLHNWLIDPRTRCQLPVSHL